jgi:hypothetical protein
MSLDWDNLETPAQAYIRKMPPEGVVVDEQSGEIYEAKSSGSNFGINSINKGNTQAIGTIDKAYFQEAHA